MRVAMAVDGHVAIINVPAFVRGFEIAASREALTSLQSTARGNARKLPG